MTSPIPTRFSPEEIAVIDRLVKQGIGRTRSDVIRRGVEHLDEQVRRSTVGRTIADSYRDVPQDADDDAQAMANAVALTEAEPW